MKDSLSIDYFYWEKLQLHSETESSFLSYFVENKLFYLAQGQKLFERIIQIHQYSEHRLEYCYQKSRSNRILFLNSTNKL